MQMVGVQLGFVDCAEQHAMAPAHRKAEPINLTAKLARAFTMQIDRPTGPPAERTAAPRGTPLLP